MKPADKPMTVAEEAELFLRLQHKPCLICGGDHLTADGHRRNDGRQA